MSNKYLIKIAFNLSQDDKKELINTGVIATAGGVTNTLADGLLHGFKKQKLGKAFAVGTGLGVLGDYAAVKINKAINHKIDTAPKSSIINKAALL